MGETKETKKLSEPVKLTPKQKKFADAYIETGNATEAAAQAYDTEKRETAQVIGSENLGKPMVRHYLENFGNEAGSVINEIMNNKKVKAETRLNAAKFVYDQVHGKAVQRMNTDDVQNVGPTMNDIVDQVISQDRATNMKRMKEQGNIIEAQEVKQSKVEEDVDNGGTDDLMEMAEATSVSLGGDKNTNMAERPATFYHSK